MNPGGNPNRSHDVTGLPPTLSDLDITKSQSSRWQAGQMLGEMIFKGGEPKSHDVTLTSLDITKSQSSLRPALQAPCPLRVCRWPLCRGGRPDGRQTRQGLSEGRERPRSEGRPEGGSVVDRRRKAQQDGGRGQL